MDRLSPQRAAKIKWQCRRGMLELDLVLNAFIEKYLYSLTEQQLTALEKLLGFPDPFLYAVFIEDLDPGKEFNELVSLLKM